MGMAFCHSFLVKHESMITALRNVASIGLLVAALLSATVGCGGGQPERTEDPAEIEKNRQEHLPQADRERQEAR
jgi:hypothetical protein